MEDLNRNTKKLIHINQMFDLHIEGVRDRCEAEAQLKVESKMSELTR
jgi:hypothetical protein